mmetsp:Transcript_54269/g.129353  ORF Transcript_54269/g.129353 Transcript_54269/m.129353 type:complete len:261 (-) Transcript_54269:110-892(-)|eukprot:CAMPEP_0178415522 /NCGR_PEP_ID=MMETSP0689_2-20121128/23593_1 /TAXON_ID=160604 /ORGANISM="Amphidinium massartii, Strain CS-259" /LENGTH=260 /DNA_ID=CAMNT_0020036841 /DNA_START=43 /DNA_END=825 /DNA_ORIENTATION=-
MLPTEMFGMGKSILAGSSPDPPSAWEVPIPELGFATTLSALAQNDDVRRQRAQSLPTEQTPAKVQMPSPTQSFSLEKMSDASGGGDREVLTTEMVRQGRFTSLMMRNVPSVIMQENLIRILEQSGFAGRFDYVYMPFHLAKARTKGYAFINMLSVEDAAALVETWTGVYLTQAANLGPPDLQAMPIYFSTAALQGLEANKQKMRQSKLQRLRNARFKPFFAERATASPPKANATTSGNKGGGSPQLFYLDQRCIGMQLEF